MENTAKSNESKGRQSSIQVEDLWKIFGQDVEQCFTPEMRAVNKATIQEETGCVVAVKEISFEVQKGEFFVLMGLSGSGKSTLIRCILRLIEPTAGKILINGDDICTYDDLQLTELRRNTTAMVFQQFGLFPHRTVLDNAAYGLKVRGVPEEERNTRAQEVLEKVGLKGWESYLPSSLSGGMQQRVGIARALTTDPEILLMDEPFSGLDPLIRRQMQDELINLQAEMQKTILFVTHDLDEALKLGSHIAIMRDGEVIQIGTPEDVITTPGDNYVREFVQDASPARVVTARNIMEQPSTLLYEWQGPRAAIQTFRASGLDSIFLVNHTGILLGLVTLERLVELVRRRGASLKDALEPELPTCNADTVIEDLFPLAASTRFPVPVIDEAGRFLGEIYNSTILISMIQEKETEDQVTEGDQKEEANA
jgi:glycine betaine/proline transport system ATP-binding protein